MSDPGDPPIPPASGRHGGPRLYSLAADAGMRQASLLDGLLVERFAFRDQVSQGFVLEAHLLTERAGHPVHALLGEPVQLQSRLADGRTHVRSGLVSAVQHLGGDGGFTRFRVTLEPWVFRLRQRRHSRVWQDKTLMQVVDELLAPYRPQAAWSWGDAQDHLGDHLAQGPQGGLLPYCVQYRESDFGFMQRLLAQHGIGWRVQAETAAAADPSAGGIGHRLVFFADSRFTPQDPTSACGAGGEGIRFHRAGPTETQDTLQALMPQRHLASCGTTLLAWDHRRRQAVSGRAGAAVISAAARAGEARSDWMEDYQPSHLSVDAAALRGAEAQHLAQLRQQAHDTRAKRWLALGNVRSLTAGHWFAVTQFEQAGARPGDTRQAQDARRQFIALTVKGLGVNNLPRDPRRRPAPFGHALLRRLEDDAALCQLAEHCGHASRIEAQRRSVPWRPAAPGQPATAHGTQTAIVVGAAANTSPADGLEIHTDHLGRVKVRFHWQDGPLADPRADNRASCWLRVARPWAGTGMGLQRTPRIGDEVVVAFIGGQAHQPIVIGSVPSGRGEAGLAATPGGVAAEADVSALRQSHDHRPGAQGNRVANGRSPAWHGGAPGHAAPDADAQNNAAAMNGFKSKEWGALGFNQLVFDDTPGQLRTQLATTQHGTQLNLGHLVHQADNHRGSFRGLGFELRTDAFGAVRAQQGVLLSTYPATFTQGVPSSPAFDNAPGMALAKQAMTLAQAFNSAAESHHTVTLSSANGSVRANQCTLNPAQAPLQALHTALSGMASAQAFDRAQEDAQARRTTAAPGTLPHSADRVVALAGKAGLAMLAGQHLQWHTDDVLSLQANRDLQCAVGGQMRWHAAQGIGVLAGAVQAGEDTGAAGAGLTLVNDKGPLDIQAQAGDATVSAKTAVSIQSATAHIDWAAARSITLGTGAGARIVIDADGVRSECPGKLTVHAVSRSLEGPAGVDYPLSGLKSDGICLECLLRSAQRASPLVPRT
jgi:type VI secretion system secreted protein VgrG